LIEYATNLKTALTDTVDKGIVTADLKGKTVDPDSEQVVDMVGFLNAVETALG
jgi:isocitrate dehydrogenase